MNSVHKAHSSMAEYSSILLISSWGFVIAIASFVFLYAGYCLDRFLRTSPTFMLGLFFLAVFMSIWKLYYEAWQKRKKV